MRAALMTLMLFAAAGRAAASDAGVPEHGAEVGARAVYYHGDDSDYGTWNPGAQIRWHFSKVIAAEGTADYQRQHFPDTTAHTLALQASVLGYLTQGRVAPFLLAGLGWYPTWLNAPDEHREFARFGPHVGAGLQWFLDEHWSLDATYRFLWLEDIHSRTPSGAPVDYRRDGHMVTLAVSYALPGK